MERDAYNREIFRTRPDYVVYRPSGELENDSENQQIIVMPTRSGDFLATWTQATRENHPDQRVVVSRSSDRGKTWTKPEVIDGATAEQQTGPERGKYQASWSFFIGAPELGRVYLFYNKNIGRTDARDDTTGVLRFRFSDDEGRTWSPPFDHLQIRRAAIDHPDPAMPVNYVTCFQSFTTGRGRPLGGPPPASRALGARALPAIPMVSFTRWGSGSPHLLEVTSEVWFLRFDNILSEPDPLKLVMTTWPDGDHGLCVPSPFKPGISVAQEAATVTLPDGRLFTVMRTLQGCLYWSQSSDGGETWSAETDGGTGVPPVGHPGMSTGGTPAPPMLFSPQPLRYRDGGARVLNPISPAPIFQHAEGKYFLIFNHNDGTAFGGRNPMDYQKNRRPTFLVCGRFDAASRQPIVFGDPKPLMDTDGVILGPSQRVEPCSYPSYFQFEGRHYLWYPDRKHFVLGKVLDEYLA